MSVGIGPRDPRPRRVVVVGYGMAAARFAEEVRSRADARRVALTVVGDEPHHAYNRVLLSGVLAGSLDPDDLGLHADGWTQRHDVEIRRGVRVVAVDRGERRIALADGTGIAYDDLVLATGASPFLPPLDGLTATDGSLAPGVIPFRTVDDCRGILAAAGPGACVVVLGGGLLGLEAARGLVGRGVKVSVVHAGGHLMERQLDSGAGRVLARRIRALGVELHLGACGVRWDALGGLVLDDGTTVPGSLLVVAAGVRAETELAAAAGLQVHRGVAVDDRLATSDPHIYAIGDCAQHPGTVGGLVQPAWDQAAILADLLTGADATARYRGTPVVTRLKAREVDLATVGDPHAEDDERTETLHFNDPSRGRYAKLALRDGRVAGAIMLGLPDAAAAVTQLFDRGAPAPSDRLALLLGRALPAEDASGSAGLASMPGDAVVCRCNTVTKGALVRAWERGARTVPALASATRATTGCGGCGDRVAGLTAWLAECDPDAEEPDSVEERPCEVVAVGAMNGAATLAVLSEEGAA